MCLRQRGIPNQKPARIARTFLIMKLFTCLVGPNSCRVSRGWLFKKKGDTDRHPHLAYPECVCNKENPSDFLPLYENGISVGLSNTFDPQVRDASPCVIYEGDLYLRNLANGALLKPEARDHVGFSRTNLVFVTVNTSKRHDSETCFLRSATEDAFHVSIDHRTDDTYKTAILELRSGDIIIIELGGVDTFKLYSEHNGVRVVRIDGWMRRLSRWLKSDF